MNAVLKKVGLFFLVLLIAQAPFAQGPPQFQLDQRFRAHVEFLADDRLEGRETGMEGERIAAEYIAAEFKALGLKPLGNSEENPYYNPFDFLAGVEYANRMLKVDGKEIEADDYYALPICGDGQAIGKLAYVGYGIHAPDLNHDDYKDKGDLSGRIFIIELGSPKGMDPHSEFAAHIGKRTKVKVAMEFGAKAVLFVNHDPEIELPSGDFNRRITAAEVPVFMIKTGDAAFNDEVCKGLEGKMAALSVKREEIRRDGRNVVALLDNGRAESIVIGGHFDHLGWGEGGGSLHRGERGIHNGADDNASGTAMVIELARALADEHKEKYNYIFIGFSGEEKGLLGSASLARKPTFDLDKVNCMINFDMVGRLDPKELIVGINGVGTSPFWPETLEKIDEEMGERLDIKTTESGIGPSDHTSFYLKDVPVLHFFSGTHSDYHKPGDDIEKVNFEGMVRIYDFVEKLLRDLEAAERIEFTKTKTEESQSVPKWTVSLGVIPDYLFEGKGMRIDGVTDGKPASKAGLKDGDIVVKMGEVDVTDMMSYMEALSRFKKGDETTVFVQRGKKTMKKKVTF